MTRPAHSAIESDRLYYVPATVELIQADLDGPAALSAALGASCPPSWPPELFTRLAMLAMQGLDLDHAKVNVHGGACAQGHPIGSTGSRIIVTLMHALHKYGKKKGVASLCIGGGEALSVAIEAM